MNTDTLLTVEDAAAHLKISKHTLNRWRVTGEGPPFINMAHAWCVTSSQHSMCGRRSACSPIPANMGGRLLAYQASPNARAFRRLKVTFLKGALPTLTCPSRSGALPSVGTRGASRHYLSTLPPAGRTRGRWEGRRNQEIGVFLASHVQLPSIT